MKKLTKAIDNWLFETSYPDFQGNQDQIPPDPKPKDSLPIIEAEVELAQIVIKPTISEEEKDRVKQKLRNIKRE